MINLSVITFMFFLTTLVQFCFTEEQNHNQKTQMNSNMETNVTSNSKNFINVTRVDGYFVKEPIISSASYKETIANNNTLRMNEILSVAGIGEYCRIHFPAGTYYFNGSAPGQDASIFTTAKYQTFSGDGINSTIIRQKNLDVRSTIKIAHSNCTVENLSIQSADFQQQNSSEWDKNPHQTAILLETQVTQPSWHTDPQILNVNINATGNNIVIDGFYRPFKTGIRSLGPWLNVYVHSMFILHVHNAIYINQGDTIAGPAKFIDVNAYAPAPTDEPHQWNTFFKSEGHFMEQVELIHCTYIGSQFIYMDGTTISKDDERFSNPPTNPVYNMIIDHCYINSLWLPNPSEDPNWSGIYLNLPPKPGGIDPGFGSELISRSIVFTYNCCAGKTPKDGAFFYIEGNLRGLTIHSNEFSSGGGDRCIYIRTTNPLIQSDVAVKDIMITDNIFNDFRNPITLGEKEYPHQSDILINIIDSNGNESNKNEKLKSSVWMQGVKITGNKTYYLPILEDIQETGMFLNRVCQATIANNQFTGTKGSSVILHECEDITLNNNTFRGLADRGKNGIVFYKSRNTTLTGNMLKGFLQGIHARDSRNLTMTGNILDCCQTGLILKDQLGLAVSTNLFSDTTTSLLLENLQDGSIFGNTIISSGKPILKGTNQNIEINHNINMTVDEK